MKRVAISSSRFQLSAPGVDVDKATADQITFDGFAGVPYCGMYLVGVVPSSAMTYRDAYSYQGIVNFGKTFDKPPAVIVRLISPHTPHALISTYLANPISDHRGTTSVGYYVTIGNSSLTVIVTGAGFPTQVGFVYAVMQV